MSTEKNVRISAEKFLYDHLTIAEPTSILFPPHSHDTCEILMILKGDLSYIVEGRVYKLKRGDIVLSRPSVFHCIRHDSAEPYERYNVVFDEKRLPRSVMQLIPKDVDVFRLEDYEHIAELFEKIDYYSERFSDEALVRIAQHLIEEIVYNLAISEVINKDVTVNRLVDKAICYIQENLMTIKNIGEICDALYITKSHLHHIFIKNIQMSPKQYIISKRLLKAQKLIRRGAKPTEIFADCGFDDYTTFFRNYKKHFGRSPSEESDAATRMEIRS